MSDDSKDRVVNGSFVDQLRDIQGEYLMLSELNEKQRTYGRKLAETMRLLQYEVDVTIPINKDSLGGAVPPLREAFLASEAVVIMVDENGNKISRQLERFPPDVILSVIQDCTPELKALITEKRRTATAKVSSLEKVLRELRKAQATFKQTQEEPAEAEEEEEEEEPEPVDEAPLPRSEQRMPPASKQTRAREAKEEAFAFRASFLEKKEAAEGPKV